jgi:hypothetical protein
MGFVASIFTAIVDVIVAIVEVVVQIVEMVVMLVMVLLGYDGGSTQIVEYFEVHNVPLFDDVDNKNPLLNSLLQSIIEEQDITSNLIYHSAFRSLKGNVKDFLNYIEQGNYFENFPTVESYILIIDYDELTAALQTLTGVPCTVENAYLRALSKADWVKYWLQENKTYNVGTNVLGAGAATVTTSPITPASTEAQSINFNLTISDEIATSDSVVINSGSAIQTSPGTPTSTYTISNEFILDITDEIATSDSVVVDQSWHINLNTITYNSSTDDYTIPAYQDNGITITLPYTAPTKPTQLHYVSTYYRNSAPSTLYLFIYQVGSGTYTDLDTVEEPIDEDGSAIKALPAIPLRINNANYTTFGATKRAQIEGIMDIIHLEAEEVLDAILTDSGVAPGDLDHIYVNFGVRMWDTSQSGMGYLFNMFENLFPSQGVTQGTYNNTPAGDDKPQNNMLITCDDYEYAFQWSYITYAFTSLATINANSGSTENGIYYSDMSRFDSNNILYNNYYVSSGKGTYNVGYKADDLDEVQDFLDGNGVPNPGATSGEATNWLQVTTRLSYNNPSPVLQESDGTTSSIIYLTPDAVYENNGSGVLRYVQQAAPETTIGQSITYYCVKPSGLDAYTVHAPIGALKVVDGDTGKFKVVKFNLGAKEDLMAPFIHNFIANLSNQQVSRLFLAGAHASIYIAHYEVIEHAGMSFLTALVMIIVIVVIAYVAWPMLKAGFATMMTTLGNIAAAGSLTAALSVAWGAFVAALPNMLIKMAAQYIIQLAITEIAGDNSELAMILNLVSMVAISAWDPGVSYGGPTYGHTGGTAIGVDTPGSLIEFQSASFSFSPSSFDFSFLNNPLRLAEIAVKVMSGLTDIALQKEQEIGKQIAAESEAFTTEAGRLYDELNVLKAAVTVDNAVATSQLVQSVRHINRGAALGGEVTYALFNAQYEVPYTAYAFSETIQQNVQGGGMYA